MKLRFLSTLFVATLFTNMVSAENKVTTLYVYGLATSFNDSTAYFTDIQKLDAAWIGSDGFLYARDNYSFQLKDYLAKQGFKNATCVTTYSTKLSDLEKKYLKSKSRYTNQKQRKNKYVNNYQVKFLTVADFQYKEIAPDKTESEPGALTKTEKKQAKRQMKQAKGQRPPMPQK